ncbi:bifunctional [glutamate--ammonia ligase]-adenylyl-L-tyrosine phosphorylase/[glutamate--ammonia-ligase] adenylyltransferase [Pseudidiomarina aestuarii]|uniref:Bifunctional glutamine synthetase adenylyltransferase/adenylyl-removing enzyme n=1 Tax=Pseudidiomarina aestuarii TaxID=624146 RepID=A0A7Z7ETC9_9GAMM|nr:bifunctional [glutamate--ammonia ligase]-adenylyl-L-tyrosine phosphorylase/[glutamate--ammonia-ligase] adenylyltransferase [Pseudidiomarina aestuarii]RUO40674.1 bifunctional [glutamate--ammonia ligase]-adenylyl-L-tyrosine phosphorylase/[glutamate--ammonia-ligase] adenylyltransferase [Pseudidiomarina aestuarii]
MAADVRDQQWLSRVSPFLARVLEQQPDAITWQQGRVQKPALEKYQSQAQQTLANCQSEIEAQRQLRLLRHRWYAQLAAADLTEELSLAEMLAHLTETADVLINAAIQWLYPRFSERFGTPRTADGEPQPLLVIGMGKLGGGELNFSSDIDLIFAYPEQGETDHPRKPIETSVFFTKLVQGLIQLLDTVTVDGRVFRVDLRLRPFGQSGPLVASLPALEHYYQEQGRDWERYAMVKARLIRAPERYQKELMQLLRPFVYRRYIDFSAIDALRKMKSLITQETRRQGVRNNIKLGPGGIREVEFIVQSFQLIRGGQQRQLQTVSLYQAYQALVDLELMKVADVQELLAGYHWLRRVEHALQQRNDEQTQVLPSYPDEQRQIAQMLGCSWDALVQKTDQHMQMIHGHFQAVIGDPDAEDEEAGDLQILWQDMVADETALEVLAERGLDADAVRQMWNSISELRQESRRRGSGPRGRKALARLVPILLEQLIRADDAVTSTERVFAVLKQIMSRTAYVELLLENIGAREQLIKLCRASSWITKQLAQYPILLDELIDPSHLYQLPELTEYPALVGEYLLRIPEQEQDLEAQMDALRQARQALQLKVAAADVSGALPLMKVSDHLSYLAEAMISHVVRLAWYQLTEKYGAPPQRTFDDTGFAVLAYGKLGGLELGYGSDLDLVFLTDVDYEGETAGPKPIEVQQFYLRLAQRILHLFTTRTLIGTLYDVDMRLRPSGKSGLLVTQLQTFDHYLAEDAWTWEMQALVRARPVHGSPRVREQLIALRKRHLQRQREHAPLAQQVQDMREKMRSHLLKKTDSFDLKQGAGGITDIEFFVQYLVLRYSHEHPALAEYTDNIRILEAAQQVGLLSPKDAQQFIDTYIDLREIVHRLALDDRESVTDADFTVARDFVRAHWARWLDSTSEN